MFYKKEKKIGLPTRYNQIVSSIQYVKYLLTEYYGFLTNTHTMANKM